VTIERFLAVVLSLIPRRTLALGELLQIVANIAGVFGWTLALCVRYEQCREHLRTPGIVHAVRIVWTHHLIVDNIWHVRVFSVVGRHVTHVQVSHRSQNTANLQ